MPESGGSGLPACHRASGRRGAGKGKIPGCGCKSGLNRIPLDVVFYPLKPFIVVNQPIKALLLPERPVLRKAVHPNSRVSGESFQWPQPPSGGYMWRDQDVHVIRHDHEGVQFIALKPPFAVQKRLDHHLRNLRSAKEQGPVLTAVQPGGRAEAPPLP